MKRTLNAAVNSTVLGLAASIALFGAPAAIAGDHPKPKRIEVAFVLDTTGSMAGLIDGAKRKIWSIANSIVDVNPDADIRMALVGYRDLGDDYVVKPYDMTADLQGLYGNLVRFKADGGGDTPESVNEALDTAVNDLEWSTSDSVRRIVFLVGDAPPHMDYDDGPTYEEIIRQARQNKIIVNTVQAGEDPETREYWQEMARLGDGHYFAIPQDGGQLEIVESPYDDEILQLQRDIDRTAVPYGSREQQDAVKSKLETRAAAPATVQVDNSEFYSKRSAREIVTGGGDLLDDLRNKVKSIDQIPADELPEELRAMSKDELEASVAEKTQARQKLEADMSELLKKRDAFVATEAAKKPAVEGDSFDRSISEALTSQF